MRRRPAGVLALTASATVASAAIAGCGGSSSPSFPSDPLGALSTCLTDAKVKNKVEKTPSAHNLLNQIGKVSVPITSDIIFVFVFKSPKDAAYYAKGGGGYTQYGHAVVLYNSYSKNKPQVGQVKDCVDSTGIGAD